MMTPLTHVVTFDSFIGLKSRIMDFCESNSLTLNFQTNIAENALTGDIYYFLVIRELEDAHSLAAIPVHNYIHMDLKPEAICGELHNYLLSRLRRNF